jgi:hypothetical protein
MTLVTELIDPNELRNHALKKSWAEPFRCGLPFVKIWLFWVCVCSIWATVTTLMWDMLFTGWGILYLLGVPQYLFPGAEDLWADVQFFGLILAVFCFALQWAQILVGIQLQPALLPQINRPTLLHAGSLTVILVGVPSGLALIAGITGSDQHAQDIARNMGGVMSAFALVTLLYSIPAFALKQPSSFRISITMSSKHFLWIVYAIFQMMMVFAVLYMIQTIVLFGGPYVWRLQPQLGLIPVLIANILVFAQILFACSVSVATLVYSYRAFGTINEKTVI